MSFTVFVKSDLQFNGQLIIDSSFRTNDSCVFAGGSGTKYKSIYYADNLKHQYFNSQEIGEIVRFFLTILKMISFEFYFFSQMANNFIEEYYFQINLILKLPSLPKKPVYYSAIFPDNLNFLSIQSSAYYNDQLNFFETNFVASSDDVNFFKIGLSSNGTIKSVLCLTYKKIKVQLYEKIIGKNSSIFMNFEENTSIDDFYDYFEQPRFRAVFHEDFEEFLKLLHVNNGKEKSLDEK